MIIRQTEVLTYRLENMKELFASCFNYYLVYYFFMSVIQFRATLKRPRAFRGHSSVVVYSVTSPIKHPAQYPQRFKELRTLEGCFATSHLEASPRLSGSFKSGGNTAAAPIKLPARFPQRFRELRTPEGCVATGHLENCSLCFLISKFNRFCIIIFHNKRQNPISLSGRITEVEF